MLKLAIGLIVGSIIGIVVVVAYLYYVFNRD